MKQLIIAMACLVAVTSCDNNNNGYRNGNVSVNSQPKIVVTPVATNLGDNLDLQALGELVKTSSNAEDIENKLNTTGSINNLDLDGDTAVDVEYLKENGVLEDVIKQGTAIAMQLVKDAEDFLASEDEEETVTETVTETTEEVEEYVDVVELPYYGYSYYDPYYDPYYISPLWLVPVVLLF